MSPNTITTLAGTVYPEGQPAQDAPAGTPRAWSGDQADGEIRVELRDLGYEQAAEEFEKVAFEPLRGWLGEIGDVDRQIADLGTERPRLEEDEAPSAAARDRSVHRLGLDPPQVENWEWLVSAPIEKRIVRL